MYRVFTMLVLMCLVSSTAGASVSISTDGVWWNALPVEKRADILLAVTSGYVEGFKDGVTAMAAKSIEHVVDIPSLSQSAQQDFVTKVVIDFRAPSFPPAFTRKTLQGYNDDITSFYATHSDATMMNFAELFKCLRDSAKTTCDKVAQDYVKQSQQPAPGGTP